MSVRDGAGPFQNYPTIHRRHFGVLDQTPRGIIAHAFERQHPSLYLRLAHQRQPVALKLGLGPHLMGRFSLLSLNRDYVLPRVEDTRRFGLVWSIFV